MNRLNRVLNISLMLLLIMAASCSKQEFSSMKSVVSYSSPAVAKVEQLSCNETQGSTIKPKVDFIFIWDNSGSSRVLDESTKASLSNLIYSISSQFDYRIVMAPLIATGNYQSFLVASNPIGLTTAATQMLVPEGSAATLLNSFAISTATKELGVQRVKSLLTDNKTNGILRTGAYTFVVMMSDGDDEDPELYKGVRMDSNPISTSLHAEWASIKAAEIKSIATNTVGSSQFRFMSLVPYSVCKSGYKANVVYKTISKAVYSASDSSDICVGNVSSFFDSINNTITQVEVKHRFAYWPVAAATANPINPASLRVVSNSGATIPMSATNGYTFSNTVQSVYLESYPIAAQPFTGYVIKLNGNAVVSTPNCLAVSFDSATEYFGYILLNSNPVVSSIKVKINGALIPNSATNGWSYYGYQDKLSTRIASPTDYSPGTPALYKTGYFIKLNGNAVISNGAIIDINYDPCAVASCN